MLKRVITVVAQAAYICLASHPAWASAITAISQPTNAYRSQTTLIDIRGLTDGSGYPCISTSYISSPYSCTGAFTVELFGSMTRLTIPTSWAGWGSPPATEASAGCPVSLPSCPPVLWSKGANDVLMTLSSPVSTFGFEAEPNAPRAEVMKATFFDTMGNEVGAISRTVTGYSGALLFAASSDTPIKFVDFTDSGPNGNGCRTCDFAIANVRFQAAPEPATYVLLGFGLVSFGLWKLRAGRSEGKRGNLQK